jgi:hypothetical protein
MILSEFSSSFSSNFSHRNIFLLFFVKNIINKNITFVQEPSRNSHAMLMQRLLYRLINL